MFIRDRKEYSQLIEDPYYCKDPKLYEIFKKSLPPKEAYYFFHKPEDILIIDKNKPENSIRRIFTNVPFTDFEKKWLKDLQKIIDSNDDLNIPMGWDDGMSLGCIYSALGDIEFAFEIMKDYIHWFESTFPMIIVPKDKSWELLNNGFLYIYGRDHQFRPIMVCQPYILQEKLDYFSNSDIVNVCLFVCQFAVNNLLIPGQIENWIILVDFDGVGLSDVGNFRKILSSLSKQRGRVYKNYFLNLGGFVKFSVNTAISMFSSVSKKTTTINSDELNKLQEFISPENIEAKFGGTAPNVTPGSNNLFPPIMPSNNYTLNGENLNIVSIDKYKEMCLYSHPFKPYVICPKYEEMWKKEEEMKKNEEKIKVANVINVENVILDEKKSDKNKSNTILRGMKKKVTNDNFSDVYEFLKEFDELYKLDKIEEKYSIPSPINIDEIRMFFEKAKDNQQFNKFD